MASLSKSKSTGAWTLPFTLADRRRIIHIGKVAKRTAEQWLVHVEELVSAKLEGRAAKSGNFEVDRRSRSSNAQETGRQAASRWRVRGGPRRAA